MVSSLRAFLDPIASWFGKFGLPEPLVHWGHPLMMGTVIFVMGSFVAYAGWRGRTAGEKEVALKNRANHRKVAPWMFTFITLGYTGGVLSLVMQDQPILESPHFLTGSVVILLLALNGLLSLGNFIGDKTGLRTIHAYLGSAALTIMFIHAFLGLKLGLSI